MSRVYWKIKFCVSEGRLEQQLHGLIMLNQSFHTLSQQVVMLSSPETKPSSTASRSRRTKQYSMIQKVSINLCRVLETACTTHSEHSALFGVDVDYCGISKGPRIGFKLAFEANTIMPSQHPVWLGVETELDGNSSVDESRSSKPLATPSRTGDSVCSHKPPGLSPEGRASHHIFPWHRHLPAAVDPKNFLSVNQNHVIVGDELPKSETILRGRLPDLSIRQNLCEHVLLHYPQMTKCAQERRLIGCLDDNQPFKHIVYLMPPQPLSENGTALSLSDLIALETRDCSTKHLSLYDKVRLARQLSSAVLQFHSTPLLGPTWKSEDIIFFGPDHDTPKRCLHSMLPHLRVNFQDNNLSNHSCPTTGTDQENDDEDEDADGIRNLYLYRLAIIFLELAYLAPITKLYDKHSKDWANCSRTQYRLAHRLSKTLSIEFGPKFGKIVRKCLACDFGQGTNLTDQELREAFYRDVVCELQTLETSLGKIFCADKYI